MADAVIELDEVSRIFPPRKRRESSVHALDRVSLTVRAGEVVGLLGHNGAGKTTVVRLIAGLLSPTNGRVRVRDLDPMTDGTTLRRLLGVLPTSAFLDSRLTARQNLRFAADMFEVIPKHLDERIDGLLDRFDLTERAEDKVDGFSAGMRQRLGLARVLLSDPEILLLDEPSAALDPLAVRMVRQLIGELARESGRTVVLCTHDLTEAQLLCDRVVVLDRGRTLAIGAPDELAAGLIAGSVEVVLAEQHLDEARAALREFVTDPVPNSKGDRRHPHGSATDTILLRCSPVESDQIPDLVRALVSAGVPVYGVQPRRAALEDVYVSLYNEDRSTRSEAEPV